MLIWFLQDEINALATTRMVNSDNSTPSREGVITSLLNEMDGVQDLRGVTIIAEIKEDPTWHRTSI
jgi:ATP-dependent 26S proteasome regulatory subunit